MKLAHTGIMFAAFVSAADAQITTETFKLTAPTPVWFEATGTGVACDPSHVLVTGIESRVHVFDPRTGSPVVEVPMPSGGIPAELPYVGYPQPYWLRPAALRGPYAVVGGNAQNSTIAFNPSDGGQAQYVFLDGAQVSLSGNRVALTDRIPTGPVQASYALWNLVSNAVILNLGTTADIHSIALSTQYLVVGAGEIRVLNPTNGALLYAIPDPDVAGDGTTGAFPRALAIDESFLIAGSPAEGGAGAVYVFDLTSGALLHTILGSSLPIGALGFGQSISASQGRILVGAPSTNELLTPDGAAFLFETASGQILAVLSPSDPGPGGDLFGISVGLSDLTAVVGAPFHSAAGGIPAGAAYLYELEPCLTPSNYCVAAPNSVGPGSSMNFAGSPSIVANDFTLLATDAPPGQSGIFFYGATAVNLPFGDGVLCAGGATFRLEPPVSIQGSGTAAHQLDFTAPPANAGLGELTPGSTWYFQFWYRDPAGGPAGFNFSNGLEVTFCF